MAVGRDDFKYAANFCEENVWHLAQDSRVSEPERQVLFITNAQKACPLWGQRRSPRAGEPVVWDYHLVLLAGSKSVMAYDLDSAYPFPLLFRDYAAKTFEPALSLESRWHPRFRLIPSAEYAAGFWSDRGHMRRPDGTWLSKPPPWPAITPEHPAFRLAELLDLTHFLSEQVLDLRQLVAQLSR